MELKICVLTVACVACLVPQAHGVFFGPHLAALAAKGAVLKGITALAAKGSMLGGAVLGAKASALASANLPPPHINKPVQVEVKPCPIYVKPQEGLVPELPTVMDKVSGFWNILRSAIHKKTELVSNVVTSLQGPTVQKKRVPVYEYQRLNHPQFYAVPIMQKFNKPNL